MKSFQFAIASLICLFTIIFFNSEAHAATTTDDGYVYEIKNYGSGDYIQITDYTGTSTSIVIPSEIEVSPGQKIPVQTIFNKAFFNKGITELTIPSSIKELDYEAFANNPLKKITYHANIYSFAFNAFSNINLEELYIPSNNYFSMPKLLEELMRFNTSMKIYADQYGNNGVSFSAIYNHFLTYSSIPQTVEFIDTKLITFNYNDGNTVEKINQNIAAALLTEPTTPSRQGYTFDGWYDGTSKWNFATDKVMENMTLQAKWTLTQTPVTYYNVTFQSNTDTSIPSQQIAKSSYVKAPEVITKKGYTFNGWYDGENKWYFLSNTISKNTTLSAKWKLNDYKMTFDSMGGNPVTTQTVPFNTAAQEPLAPTKEGYTFAGWYNGENKWQFTTDFIQDNMVLTAKWQVKNYTVSFDSQGGSKVKSTQVDYLNKAIEPKKPTKKEYTFIGWYNGKTKFMFPKQSITKDTKLVAKWQLIDRIPAELKINPVTTKSKTISGKTEPNTVVELYRNGAYTKKVRSNSKGNFKIELYVQVTKKATFSLQSVDQAGNKKMYSIKVK